MNVDVSTKRELDSAEKEWAEQRWVAHDRESFGGSVTREGIALVARLEGELVGTLTGWLSMGVGYINELIVDDAARCLGVGSRLLRGFEEHASSTGHHRLALRTEADGDSLEFYRKRGWTDELHIEDWLGGKPFTQMRKDV